MRFVHFVYLRFVLDGNFSIIQYKFINEKKFRTDDLILNHTSEQNGWIYFTI